MEIVAFGDEGAVGLEEIRWWDVVVFTISFVDRYCWLGSAYDQFVLKVAEDQFGGHTARQNADCCDASSSDACSALCLHNLRSLYIRTRAQPHVRMPTAHLDHEGLDERTSDFVDG